MSWPAGIASGIEAALAREDVLRQEMRALRVEKTFVWFEERRQLAHLVGMNFADQRASA